ncbi:MAG: hypothetical protein F6K42_01680 [Leptolyngbya sp. SIO1D8]|nr:hypothetical protein [Leptolyngbya sp. SIO1D8]
MPEPNNEILTLTDVLARIDALKPEIQEQGKQLSVEIEQLKTSVETLTTLVGNPNGNWTIQDSLTKIQSDPIAGLTLLLTLLAIIVALAAYVGEVRRRLIDKASKAARGSSEHEKHKLDAASLLWADIPLIAAGIIISLPIILQLWPIIVDLISVPFTSPNWNRGIAVSVGGVATVLLIGIAISLPCFHVREWGKSIEVLRKQKANNQAANPPNNQPASLFDQFFKSTEIHRQITEELIRGLQTEHQQIQQLWDNNQQLQTDNQQLQDRLNQVSETSRQQQLDATSEKLQLQADIQQLQSRLDKASQTAYQNQLKANQFQAEMEKLRSLIETLKPTQQDQLEVDKAMPQSQEEDID